MPVLGADPATTHVHKERTTNVRNYDLFRLSDYLLHHPHAHVMQHPPRHEHGQIALRTVARLFRRGYSYQQIRSAIDKFYARYSEFTSNPVYLFTSNSVLQELFAGDRVATTDPVLQYIADGFVRGSLDLFWHEDDDDDIRKAIMVTGSELVYRYPDVVALSIAEHHDDMATLREQVRLISSVLHWNLGDADDFDVQAILDRIVVPLPRELSTAMRSPQSIRPPQQTLSAAVAQVTQKASTNA
jgi:hypothetical protein